MHHVAPGGGVSTTHHIFSPGMTGYDILCPVPGTSPRWSLGCTTHLNPAWLGTVSIGTSVPAWPGTVGDRIGADSMAAAVACKGICVPDSDGNPTHHVDDGMLTVFRMEDDLTGR